MSLLANLLLEASARVQFRHACHPSVHISVQCCEFKYCNPKNCFSALGIWSGLSIPDPNPDFLPIPDPGVKKAPDPGYTALYDCLKILHIFLLLHSAMIFLYTEIHFISIGDKFGICAVVGLNGTLVEAKMRTFKCPKCELNHREKKNLALYKPFNILWEKYPMGTVHADQELWRSGPAALHHTEHWQRGDSLSGIQAHTHTLPHVTKDFYSGKSGLWFRVRITLIWIRIQLFTFMLIWILLLFKGLRICDHFV